MFQRNLFQSFKYATKGLTFAIKNERNMRLHCIIAVVVIIVAAVLKISHTDWILLIFTITFVFIAEIINTAFELLLDHLHCDQYHATVKVLKDISAGGVLIAAINAAVIGCIIFLPFIIK